VSAGDITRAFETIAWDSDELNRSVRWKAPDAPGLTRVWSFCEIFAAGVHSPPVGLRENDAGANPPEG
jgi:hypothetical protein